MGKKAVLAFSLLFLSFAVFFGYLAHTSYCKVMEYVRDYTLDLLVRSAIAILWYVVFTLFSALFLCLSLYVLIQFISDSKT